MFTSNEWKYNTFVKTKTNYGKIIEDVVLDKNFWKNIITCLNGTLPLIEVLQLVDSSQKLAMSFIYEAMKQSKDKYKRLSMLSEKSILFWLANCLCICLLG